MFTSPTDEAPVAVVNSGPLSIRGWTGRRPVSAMILSSREIVVSSVVNERAPAVASASRGELVNDIARPELPAVGGHVDLKSSAHT